MRLWVVRRWGGVVWCGWGGDGGWVGSWVGVCVGGMGGVGVGMGVWGRGGGEEIGGWVGG